MAFLIYTSLVTLFLNVCSCPSARHFTRSRNKLQKKPYKIKYHLELLPHDYIARRKFSDWFIERKTRNLPVIFYGRMNVYFTSVVIWIHTTVEFGEQALLHFLLSYHSIHQKWLYDVGSHPILFFHHTFSQRTWLLRVIAHW